MLNIKNNKKYIICFLLSFALIFSSLFFNPSSVNAKLNSKYKKVIEKAIKSSEKTTYYKKATGFLYDFDKNGTKELVVMYGKKTSYGGKYVLSVYTLKNKKLKTLMKEKTITKPVQSYSGMVAVAKKNGKSYLMLEKGYGITPHNTVFKMYKIKGSTIKCKQIAKCSAYDNYEEGESEKVITISGKNKTYDQFMEWQKSFKLKYGKRKLFHTQYDWYRYDSTAKSLKKLLQ